MSPSPTKPTLPIIMVSLSAPCLISSPSRCVHVLPGAHPLDARPGKELVAGRVPAGIPGVEEQAALILVADVAREVDPGPGRDPDSASTAQEPFEPRRVFPHALLALITFQSVSFLYRIRHRLQATGITFHVRR